VAYKIISIPVELYKKLAAMKGKKDSFASVIARCLPKEKPELKEFFGTWKMTNEEEARMRKVLKKMWGSKHEMLRF